RDVGQRTGARDDGRCRPRGRDPVRARARGRTAALVPRCVAAARTRLDAADLARRRPQRNLSVYCGKRDDAVILMLQAGARHSALDMIVTGGLSTHIILGVLAALSLMSWVIIFWKIAQFRKVRRQGAYFVRSLERTQRLEDAYKSVVRLPESPYTRVFRQGINFFSELRPGALKENAPPTPGLTEA